MARTISLLAVALALAHPQAARAAGSGATPGRTERPELAAKQAGTPAASASGANPPASSQNTSELALIAAESNLVLAGAPRASEEAAPPPLLIASLAPTGPVAGGSGPGASAAPATGGANPLRSSSPLAAGAAGLGPERPPGPPQRTLAGSPAGPEVAAEPHRRNARFGVLVGTGGVQQVARAELVVRMFDTVSLVAGGGFLPQAVGAAALSLLNVSGGKLSSWSVDAGLHVSPFRGSFFLGASVGQMNLSASATTQAGPVALAISSVYLAPRMGWLAIWDAGFSLGFDLGMQIALSSNVTVTGQKTTDVESMARTLATLPLPTMALRLGWML